MALKILWLRFHPQAGFGLQRIDAETKIGKCHIVRVDGGFAIDGRWISDAAVAEAGFEGEWPFTRAEELAGLMSQTIDAAMKAGEAQAKLTMGEKPFMTEYQADFVEPAEPKPAKAKRQPAPKK